MQKSVPIQPRKDQSKVVAFIEQRTVVKFELVSISLPCTRESSVLLMWPALDGRSRLPVPRTEDALFLQCVV